MMSGREWWSDGMTLVLVSDRAELTEMDVPESVRAVVLVKSKGCRQIVSIDTLEMIVDLFRAKLKAEA